MMKRFILAAVAAAALASCSSEVPNTAPAFEADVSRRTEDQASVQQPTQRRYRYTDLGVLGKPGGQPERSVAYGINDAGQVVGVSTTTQFGASHAFVWQNGQLKDLGTLSSSRFGGSGASAINAAGVNVGSTSVDPSNSPGHAYDFRNGAMRDLGTGYGGLSFSRALDINNRGEIVGERSRQQSSPVRAFLYRNGQFRDLGTLGGRSTSPFSTESIAYAINDLGQVVGTALPPTLPTHAFLWQNGVMRDLGTLGGNGEATIAYAINEVSQVVGWSQTAAGQTHAFLWQTNTMRDLGTFGGDFSGAYGINVHGQIVGGSRIAGAIIFNAGHAFLWENGRLLDLNRLVTNLPGNVVLETARAILDDGRIVGETCSGYCDPGATAPHHAYLLTPVSR